VVVFLPIANIRAINAQEPNSPPQEKYRDVKDKKLRGWTVKTETSLIDDSRTVIVSKNANNEIVGWPKKSFIPILVIRHKEGRVECFVNTGMAPHVESGTDPNEASCTIRFDKEKATTIPLKKSTSQDALFWSAPKRWIKRMLSSKQMVFRFTPYNSNPQTCIFNLEGLRNAIRPLEDASGWHIGSIEDRLGFILSTNACIPSALGYAPKTEIGDLDLCLFLKWKVFNEYAPLRQLAIKTIIEAIAQSLNDKSIKKDLPQSLRVILTIPDQVSGVSSSELKREFLSAAKKCGIADRLEIKSEKPKGKYPAIIRLVGIHEAKGATSGRPRKD